MAPTANHGSAETTAPLNPLNPEIERTDPSREIGMALSDLQPRRRSIYSPDTSGSNARPAR